ncbi:MAG: SCP2 sterol-binding domain-containing protein, partial [Syntrophales bacterium]|nr:SCP2 sterol-binding domain-containing protein [Syntrophales bacterium]
MAAFYGTTVQDIFATMPARFKPTEAREVDIVIGYICGGEGGGKWRVTVKDRQINVENVTGDLGPCTATVEAADAETFIGVTLNKIAAVDALTAGRLRVMGDASLLMNLLPRIFSPYTPVVKGVTAREMVSGMKERFRPDKAAGVSLKFAYDLTGEGGGRFTITIADGQCIVTEGLDTEVAVQMTMDAATSVSYTHLTLP